MMVTNDNPGTNNIGKTNQTFYANENELPTSKSITQNLNSRSTIIVAYPATIAPITQSSCSVDINYPPPPISPPCYALLNLPPPPSYEDLVGKDSVTSNLFEELLETIPTETTQNQEQLSVYLPTIDELENTVPNTTPTPTRNTCPRNQNVKQSNFTKCIMGIVTILFRSTMALIFLILTVINGAICSQFGKEFVPLLALGILQSLFVYVIVKQRKKTTLIALCFIPWLVTLIFAGVWLYSKPNAICKTCQYPSNLKNVSNVCASVKIVNIVFVGIELGTVCFLTIFSIFMD